MGVPNALSDWMAVHPMVRSFLSAARVFQRNPTHGVVAEAFCVSGIAADHVNVMNAKPESE
jgi:hypothetical protein